MNTDPPPPEQPVLKSEIVKGSRVRCKIYSQGLHVRNYNGVVKKWNPNGTLSVLADDGKTKSVSADNVKLLRQ